MRIEIRKAEPTDFKHVHKLIMEFATFIKTPEKVRITPEQMIKDKDFFNCIIAIFEEEIIGFATFFFSYYSWTGKAIYLDDLYVRKEYQGNSIGSRMFDRIMDLGKQENCHIMKWQVSNWNTKAQDFYKDRGAIIDDIEINCCLELNDI